MKRRNIIYSCLVGNYDDIPKVYNHNSDWEYILFTDTIVTSDSVNGWTILPLIHSIEGDPVRTNRWHKINSHLVFENCQCSIYIDANIIVKDNMIFETAENLLKQNVFLAMLPHNERDCIYDEAEICIKRGKDTKTKIQQNIDFLLEEKFPKKNGLYENSIIFRNHSYKEELRNFNELWWSLVASMARRDQLSLGYVLWKLDIKPVYLFGDNKTSHRNHPSFEFVKKHKIRSKAFDSNQTNYHSIKYRIKKWFKSF